MSVFEEIDSKMLEEIVLHLWNFALCTLNASHLSGTFPNSLKTAVVNPLLKKRNLDNSMLSNFRPILNLPFIILSFHNIIEIAVFNQLNKYLNSNGYLDNFQSGL